MKSKEELMKLNKKELKAELWKAQYYIDLCMAVDTINFSDERCQDEKY